MIKICKTIFLKKGTMQSCWQ